jgi:GNAT superfamily N-acetyltransferase
MTILRTLELPSLKGHLITLEVGEVQDFCEVRWILDTYSSGLYGFVPHGRIRRHLEDGEVHLIRIDDEIAAVAIGKPGATLWNIMALPEYRHLHLGTILIEATKPESIRVKCRPHKDMGDEDLKRFSDPTPFYERMGYVEEGWDYPRNFYLGKNTKSGKGNYVVKGNMRNVKIMRLLKPGEVPPEKDLSRGPNATSTEAFAKCPRVRSEVLHRAVHTDVEHHLKK